MPHNAHGVASTLSNSAHAIKTNVQNAMRPSTIVGSRSPQREAAVHVLERMEKPFAALDRAAAPGTDCPQWKPLSVVADESRPKPRP
jgi:hypothetical protein